jgi:gas vesicle protein
MSLNKKSSKLKKGGSFEYAKMFKSSLSPCDKKNMTNDNNSQNGGSSCDYAYINDNNLNNYNVNNNPDTSIRLYNDYSQDWHYPDTPMQEIPYAIDSSAGINEYQFGRLTPNNKFIVATGLVKNKVGIEMTGGSNKKKKPKSSVMKTAKKVGSSIKKVAKKVGSSIIDVSKKVKPIIKKVAKKVGSSISKISEKVKPTMKKVGKKVKSSVSKISEKVKPTMKKVGKKVGSSISKISEKVKPTMKKVGKKVKSSVSKISEKVKPTMKNVGKKIKSKSPTKKSKSILNKTKKTLKSVGKKVSSIFS